MFKFLGSWFSLGISFLLLILFTTTTSYSMQALACVFIWVNSYFLSPRLVSLLLSLFSVLPFLFSPSYLIKNGSNMEILYGFAQMSPFYQVFRLNSDPWNSKWAYVDSPFHYAVEGGLLPIAILPLILLLLLMFLTTCLNNNAKS